MWLLQIARRSPVIDLLLVFRLPSVLVRRLRSTVALSASSSGWSAPPAVVVRRLPPSGFLRVLSQAFHDTQTADEEEIVDDVRARLRRMREFLDDESGDSGSDSEIEGF